MGEEVLWSLILWLLMEKYVALFIVLFVLIKYRKEIIQWLKNRTLFEMFVIGCFTLILFKGEIHGLYFALSVFILYLGMTVYSKYFRKVGGEK